MCFHGMFMPEAGMVTKEISRRIDDAPVLIDRRIAEPGASGQALAQRALDRVRPHSLPSSWVSNDSSRN